MSAPDEIVVISTRCKEWSLNIDSATSKQFWWNGTYSISCWQDTLKVPDPVAEATDDHVWNQFLTVQVHCAFKMCSICTAPEGNEDLLICCYCGSCVHSDCSLPASSDQIAWKRANIPYSSYMRECFACGDISKDQWPRTRPQREVDNVRRAAGRALTLDSELPPTTLSKIRAILAASEHPHNEEELMSSLQHAMSEFFQPKNTAALTRKESIASKGGGVGVIAAVDIPAFTVIGVYPGYVDALSSEQMKLGRPLPIYALMDLNCANYYNDVFVEFANTATPFVNEPCPEESANCAWIQQTVHREGRLSIITVCDVKRGEELLIGYGPSYSRKYPFAYDAYAFHKLDEYTDPPCFSLWRWRSLEAQDADFVCYIGYNSEDDTYSYWETQDEFDARNASPPPLLKQ